MGKTFYNAGANKAYRSDKTYQTEETSERRRLIGKLEKERSSWTMNGMLMLKLMPILTMNGPSVCNDVCAPWSGWSIPLPLQLLLLLLALVLLLGLRSRATPEDDARTNDWRRWSL